MIIIIIIIIVIFMILIIIIIVIIASVLSRKLPYWQQHTFLGEKIVTVCVKCGCYLQCQKSTMHLYNNNNNNNSNNNKGSKVTRINFFVMSVLNCNSFKKHRHAQTTKISSPELFSRTSPKLCYYSQ